MSDLTDFLLARIAEDKAMARAVLALHGSGTNHPLGHPLDPARVLADCRAKRQIVEDLLEAERSEVIQTGGSAVMSDALKAQLNRIVEGATAGVRLAACRLASVYAEHPDFRPEWRA